MECLIITLDANSNPIIGAGVALDSQTAVTGVDGTVRMITAVVQDNTLNVWHTHFLMERVRFQGSITNGKYNNALVSRNKSTSPVTLTVRMCRCRTMPVVKMDSPAPTAELMNLAKAKGDPKAALIWQPHDYPSNPGNMFRQSWLAAKPIRLAEPILLPETAPADDKLGWDRFNHKIAKPDVDIQEKSGRFFWLTYPGVGTDDQYGVFIWSPNIALSSPPSALDMIIYFTPTTKAYTVKYPYGVQMFEGSPDQQYMSLGRRHMETEMMLVYQLAARKREAVLVMPLCKKDDWGPFTSGEGLFRLCREISLFLHRECRTSNIPAGPSNPIDPQMRHAGATLRQSNESFWADDFGEPPQPGRLAVTFFSNGALPVKKLMETWELDGGKFAQSFWGCPRTMQSRAGIRDAEVLLREQWLELWDIDGWHPETGSWPSYLTKLQTWVFRNQKRVVRLCHSSGRVPPDPRIDKHSLWKALIGEGVVSESSPEMKSPPWARELHGRRWSAVAFDNEYISHVPGGNTDKWLHHGGLKKWQEDQEKEKKPSQVPWLIPDGVTDAHLATPRIGFSHCVALSPLGTRS